MYRNHLLHIILHWILHGNRDSFISILPSVMVPKLLRSLLSPRLPLTKFWKKSRIGKTLIITLAVLAFLTALPSGLEISRVQAATPTYTIDPAGLLHHDWSYLIYKSGSDYYAINGDTCVVDYGGSLDAGGVDGTDAATVIQSAIYASPNGGKIVLKGKFSLTATLILETSIWLAGIGVGGTGYEEATILENLQTDGSHCISASGKVHLKISDMLIVGNENSGDGIRVENSEIIVDNVFVSSHGGYGFYGIDCFNGRGLFFSQFYGNGKAGVYMNNCNGFAVEHVICKSNTEEGLVTIGCEALKIDDGLFEANGKDQILIWQVVHGTSIMGAYVEYNSDTYYGINLKGVSASYKSRGIHIGGGTLVHNSGANSAIRLEYVDHCKIEACSLSVPAGVPHISIGAGVTNLIIDPTVEQYGDGTKQYTENSGTATFSGTSVEIAHGLAGTPDQVFASFNSTGYSGYTWTANSTHITITVANTGDYTVYWRAYYEP